MKSVIKIVSTVLFIIATFFSLTIVAGLFPFDPTLLIGGIILMLTALLPALWLRRKYQNWGKADTASSGGDESRAATCIYCNRNRKPSERFTRYGLCQQCDRVEREAVKSTLSTIQLAYNTYRNCDIDALQARAADTKAQLQSVINIIDTLEEKRAKLPFFKSSTIEKRDLFVSLISKLEDAPTPDYFYENVFVAGCQHYDIAEVTTGAKLELAREPENQHDKNAIMVLCNQACIGYVLKGTHQDMIHDFWGRGQTVVAEASNVEDGKVYMSLAFYK